MQLAAQLQSRGAAKRRRARSKLDGRFDSAENAGCTTPRSPTTAYGSIISVAATSSVGSTSGPSSKTGWMLPWIPDCWHWPSMR